jgi:hypothetical protein
MDRQNQLFIANVANYLANHSIIVPSSFTDDNPAGRRLANGRVYNFDLQTMAPGGHVNVQGAAELVILTEMAHRGRGTWCLTRTITAMWLRGPAGAGQVTANLPVGINYVFTESLGGCSVYINGGQIVHNFAGVVPGGVPANQQVTHPYPGSAGNFDQTCAVAYRVAGAWHVGTSVPHDVGGHHRVHAGSGYEFLGY